MSVPLDAPVPVVPVGSGASGGAHDAGVRPRPLHRRATPARARRVDRRPLPRLRSLAAVLAEQVGPPVPDDLAPARSASVAAGSAWDTAMETARAQVAPLAVGFLGLVAEVLDGRRPPGHLAAACPPGLLDTVRTEIARARRAAPGFPRGARVRGLRTCAVVGGGVRPVLAVEVAAVLAVPDPTAARSSPGASTRPPPGSAARPSPGASAHRSPGASARPSPGAAATTTAAVVTPTAPATTRPVPSPPARSARAVAARFELGADRTWHLTALRLG